MKYPINADKYIKAARLLYGVNPDNEAAYRRLIPIVNDCYAAGLLGAKGFPLDAADLFCATAEDLGCPLEPVMRNKTTKQLIPLMVKRLNQAYEQGREDAAKGECCGTFG